MKSRNSVPPAALDLVDLARRREDLSPAPPARLERATLELSLDGRRELVVVTARDGELRVVTAEGATEGPFVEAALALLAGVGGSPARSESPSSPGTERPPPRLSSPLGDALEELLIAVVRSGIEAAPSSTAVREALEHVLREAPRPTPPGLGRALARLRRALADNDVDMVSRILDGGARLARDLREELPTAEALRRIAAWTHRSTQRHPSTQSISERELVEVGREWLPPAGTGSLQRRYLVCTQTGEVFREERSRGEEASVGPCPRVLRVGLATLEDGPAPRRIRLLQYEVSPALDARVHERLAEMAEREAERVVEHDRQVVRQYPALAEPVAILRADGRLREEGDSLALADDGGALVPLHAPAGIPEVLRERFTDACWIAGRLTESDGSVVLDPFSVGIVEGSSSRVVRL